MPPGLFLPFRAIKVTKCLHKNWGHISGPAALLRRVYSNDTARSFFFWEIAVSRRLLFPQLFQPIRTYRHCPSKTCILPLLFLNFQAIRHHNSLGFFSLASLSAIIGSLQAEAKSSDYIFPYFTHTRVSRRKREEEASEAIWKVEKEEEE